MTVPPLQGQGPSRPYITSNKRGLHLLPYHNMVCDYESESCVKFLLLSQPNEGNFTLRVVYESALSDYQLDHDWVMEACK